VGCDANLLHEHLVALLPRPDLLDELANLSVPTFDLGLGLTRLCLGGSELCLRGRELGLNCCNALACARELATQCRVRLAKQVELLDACNKLLLLLSRCKRVCHPSALLRQPTR